MAVLIWTSTRGGPRLLLRSQRQPWYAVSVSTKTVSTRMEVRNLIDGGVEYSALIKQEHSASSGSTTAPKLLVAGDTLLYLNGAELILATIPESVAKAMPVPVHFLLQQTVEIKAHGHVIGQKRPIPDYVRFSEMTAVPYDKILLRVTAPERE